MKRFLALTCILSVSLICTAAHAQGGGVFSGPCTDSPENPTVLLALIGSAGVGFAEFRARRAQRRSRQH